VFPTSAAPRFNGSTGYEFLNNMASVAISVGMIDNTTPKAGTTGTLMVKLYATTTPYTGGSINGYVVGSFKLDQLKAGQFYRDLRKVVPYVAPSAKGSYYMTLTLLEYGTNGYSIVDYRNMKNTAALGPLKTFTLTGPWRWQTSYTAGTVAIEVAKVSHRRQGKTGTLKVSVWATDTPHRGGGITGHQIGFFTKDGLESGYSYTGLKQTVKFSPPPDGTYFITLALAEWDDGAYRIVDYITSSEASTFKRP
jgi:hypothetical protein